jgi:polyisoprenoid-binding protein YceI
MTTGADTRQATLVPPGTWEVDAQRSTVGFEVRHLKLSHVRGRFRALSAIISCDGSGVASIAAFINVASIDTGEPKRDARLCAKDFFDAELHPMITYHGVFSSGDGDGLLLRGAMTIRGASRPMQLRVEPSAPTDGDSNGERWLHARGLISRSEFGLEWDSAFAAGGLVIDDRVALLLDVLVRRARAY